MGTLDPAEVRRWTVSTCQAQGVPVAVTDPSTVADVATLLTGAARRPPGRRTAAVKDATPDGLAPA
jgi:hypothetical protein